MIRTPVTAMPKAKTSETHLKRTKHTRNTLETHETHETHKKTKMTSEDRMELPKYKCHKEVWAIKIKDIVATPLKERKCTVEPTLDIIPEDVGYGQITVSDEYYQKHSPKVGGYYVVYEDGYKSYSPAGPFEAGYTAI